MSTISEDGRYVQLWDLLTHVPIGETDLVGRCERQRKLGQRVKDELNKAARVHGQEYDMVVTDTGVELRVFSCIGDGEKTLRVFIPTDRGEPIRVEVGTGHKATLWKPVKGKAKKTWKCMGRIR